MEPLDILREDLAQTLGFIDKCDNHLFQIKNWALLTSSAVIAFSVCQNYAEYVLMNIVLLGAFSCLELIYKSFQDSAIEHSTDLSQRIDGYFADPSSKDLLADYEHGFGRRLEYP